jgi:hypothetical protein
MRVGAGEVAYERDGITLYCGDSREILPTLADSSVDAVITDPPAGIAFMGLEFDRSRGGRAQWVAWLSSILAECLRVAKPGARLLCWSIPRTSHWTGCAIEDAGWIVEDQVSHLFATGFPKSKGKLKPAREDWWVARKPGGKVPDLNIDACRIAAGGAEPNARRNKGVLGGYGFDPSHGERGGWDGSSGRWPPNVAFEHHELCECVGTKRVKGTAPTGPNPGKLGYGGSDKSVKCRDYNDADGLETVSSWTCHEDCPVRLLDEQAGERSSGAITGERRGMGYDQDRPRNRSGTPAGNGREADSGSASRFFFCSKASPEDRGAGNTHPTVKSTDLMRWLIRLVTPPDGLILDPFAGSGSTLVAAYHEHFRCIGIEREPEYIEIGKRRLAAASLPLFAEARSC